MRYVCTCLYVNSSIDCNINLVSSIKYQCGSIKIWNKFWMANLCTVNMNILNMGSILSTCHLWKCRYRVYWNISYPLSILKVIFLKSNPETLILPLERGCNPTLCYGKCWPNILSKATFNKTNFWFIFSHFYYIKS
jgi:hypothetical protein